MALLSRSSLRGSVRRTPDEPSADEGQAPPTKRQRTTHGNGHRHRRRKSSPDCLDTTTPDAVPEKARSANPPLKAARPRTSTRHARLPSASSVGTDASGEYRVNGNGASKSSGQADREIAENASATDLLRGARESPDPLDMISQVDDDDTPRTRPRTSSGAAGAGTEHATSPTTRVTRQSDRGPTNTDSVQTKARAEGTRDDNAQLGVNQPAQRSKSDQVASEPHTAERTDGRRSLRSADTGSRCKSELAQYFFNYEQIISLEETKPEFLAGNTIITLVDDLTESLPTSTSNPSPFGNPLKELHNCEVIELCEPALRSSGVDPLSEEVYFRAHRKFERQEKQLRNIERDRAQHEKQQVERLLEELRSPDWLRVMGLTSVHESEKKLYEPKRQILIQELIALVTKFQTWKDEERRRKLAKDKPLPIADTDELRRPRKRSRPADEIDTETSPLSDTLSTPDPSDVDAWAARQLHQEARSASAAKRRKSVSDSRKPRVSTDGTVHSKDNKSTGKRQKTLHEYLASGATPASSSKPLDNHNLEIPSTSSPADSDTDSPPDDGWKAHTGPSVLFGQRRPRIKEREFEPPPELLTEEAIQASQRQRRRLKRQSGDG